MFTLINWFYKKAALDAAVTYSILTRIIQSVNGIIALLFVTHFLDKTEQGYYYTFSSILAIQIFFELGLTTILTQFVAHEVAHLVWKNKITLQGEEYYKGRLASIIYFGVKWFTVVSVLLFFVLFFAGKFFFSTYRTELDIDWHLPWLILSLSASLILLINLFMAILEGLGKIKEINKLRLIQQAMNLLFLVLFFLSNLKLMSYGLALLISAFITALIFIFSGYYTVIKTIWHIEVKWKIDYKKEVLPFQFQIGTGYMSSYLIYYLINPVLFATQGAVIAGQMGATQSFLNGILAVSLSWMSTKVALFSNLVSRKEFEQLNVLYKKNRTISSLICIIGLIVFIGSVLLLKNYYPSFGNRFLPVFPIILLGLTLVASVIGSCQGYYLRSFKKEPFFISSIVIGITSGAATVLTSKYGGITELSLSYFIINGLIGFIWGCIIFKNKSYDWTKTKHLF